MRFRRVFSADDIYFYTLKRKFCHCETLLLLILKNVCSV